MLAVDPATASRRRHYPSISLLLPLDGPTPWPARLRGLQREATTRLQGEFGADIDAGLLLLLDRAVSNARTIAGARSLAVFVNAEGAECVGMAVTVRERVVIDDTFATRDLVHHDLRSPRYWVLALTLDEPRLLHGHGPALHLHHLELRDAATHPSSSRGGRGRERSAVVDANRVRRLKALDSGLTEALARTADPVIVVGAEPTLSRFLDRTRHLGRIEGIVRRAPDADLRLLSRIVAPAVADVLGERRELALAALERAMSAGTAASGIDQVWLSARRARRGLLLVEEQYEHPAVVTPDGALGPAPDPAAPGVVDDLVDEVIELVLGAGGRVELLGEGALSAHQRIAFVPQQRAR